MKIQHTNISRHGDDLSIVDILIANDPEPDEGQEKIQFVCQVELETNQRHSLEGLQVKALEHVLDELNRQRSAVQAVLHLP